MKIDSIADLRKMVRKILKEEMPDNMIAEHESEQQTTERKFREDYVDDVMDVLTNDSDVAGFQRNKNNGTVEIDDDTMLSVAERIKKITSKDK